MYESTHRCEFLAVPRFALLNAVNFGVYETLKARNFDRKTTTSAAFALVGNLFAGAAAGAAGVAATLPVDHFSRPRVVLLSPNAPSMWQTARMAALAAPEAMVIRASYFGLHDSLRSLFFAPPTTNDGSPPSWKRTRDAPDRKSTRLNSSHT